MAEVLDIRQQRSSKKKRSAEGGPLRPVILACDTSTTVGSVALVEGGVVTAETLVKSRMSHSLRILKDVQAMLAERELKMEDIDAFVTAAGPGSFTGVRIAMSTLKGLAWSLKKPLITIGSLHALAMPLLHRGHPVMAALDAKRHEVYAAVFAPDGAVMVPPAAVAPTDLLKALMDAAGPETPVICVGEGIAEYRDVFADALGDRMIQAPAWADCIRASVMGVMGTAEYGTGGFCDLATVEPVYLRRSEAEINLESRNKQA